MRIKRRIAAALRHSPSAVRESLAAPAASTSGMGSSAQPLATQAGLEILAKGGNAF